MRSPPRLRGWRRARRCGTGRAASAGPSGPRDIAILFRSRASHREFEEALEARRIPTYVYKGLGFFDADEVRDVVALLRFLAEPSSDLRAAAFLRSRVVRLSDPGLQRLAPGIAAALTASAPPPAAGASGRRGRARCWRACAPASPDWLALADRIPPAELLDRVLADSAYDHEIRGSRAVAARENIKKIRSLVRRMQNRGYLTLARLADHLDRLSAGDESNAVVDAVDAVNLMTVHAAKGLEFPVVFVVNLSRGSGGPRAPIRVAAHAEPEDAVAVGDFESEFDADEAAREREETKRLMYVALTRARDRLYLATATTDGAFKPRKGSLGDVLPESIRGVFAQRGRGIGGRRGRDMGGRVGRGPRVQGLCARARSGVRSAAAVLGTAGRAGAGAGVTGRRLRRRHRQRRARAQPDHRDRRGRARAGERPRRPARTTTGAWCSAAWCTGCSRRRCAATCPHDELAAIARGLVSG